jgi:hypothetical protein
MLAHRLLSDFTLSAYDKASTFPCLKKYAAFNLSTISELSKKKYMLEALLELLITRVLSLIGEHAVLKALELLFQ